MFSLFGKLGRHATAIRAVRSGVLTVAGFGAVTFAAFQWHVIAGWVVVGVSCFALDWYSERGTGGQR